MAANEIQKHEYNNRSWSWYVVVVPLRHMRLSGIDARVEGNLTKQPRQQIPSSITHNSTDIKTMVKQQHQLYIII